MSMCVRMIDACMCLLHGVLPIPVVPHPVMAYRTSLYPLASGSVVLPMQRNTEIVPFRIVPCCTGNVMCAALMVVRTHYLYMHACIHRWYVRVRSSQLSAAVQRVTNVLGCVVGCFLQQIRCNRVMKLECIVPSAETYKDNDRVVSHLTGTDAVN